MNKVMNGEIRRLQAVKHAIRTYHSISVIVDLDLLGQKFGIVDVQPLRVIG
jgi:hypothetical protein